MAQELRQDLRLSQQLIMTPQLQLAIKLLQLSRLELVETIREEVQKNPLLELEELEKMDTSLEGAGAENVKEVDTVDSSASTKVSEERDDPLRDIQSSDNETDVELYDYLNRWEEKGYVSAYEHKQEDTSFEAFISKKTTLTDHLLWQMRLMRFSPEEEEIGTFIIGNIDDDGYLKITISEIAEALNAKEETVEHVLKRIQEFDPVGVGSRDLKESLLTQIKFLPSPDPILEEIVRDHLHYLQKKDYQTLSKELGVDYKKVIEAVKVIQSLEPKPGRAYSVDDVHYIVPDVYVYKVGEEFVILLNDDGMSKLRLSNYYRNMLRNEKVLNKDEKAYLKEKLRSAIWFIKSIHQRQRTLYKVVSCIVDFQKEFLDKGIEYLRPLILKDVAEIVGVHESTVSRVTANKFAYTPQGIYELKFFFNKGFDRGGENIASETIKDQIRKIISSEDPRKPYTDQAIVRILRESNIDIARRTVAKYREMMGILPSSKRKNPF